MDVRSGSLTTCGEKLPTRRHNASTSSDNGGLGDVNPAGSLRVIQMLGHGSEVTQVAQFHIGQTIYRQNLLVQEQHTISRISRQMR